MLKKYYKKVPPPRDSFKFKNFLDINENVKYIDSGVALKFIETSSQ